jgi:hypothetical protein
VATTDKITCLYEVATMQAYVTADSVSAAVILLMGSYDCVATFVLSVSPGNFQVMANICSANVIL